VREAASVSDRSGVAAGDTLDGLDMLRDVAFTRGAISGKAVTGNGMAVSSAAASSLQASEAMASTHRDSKRRRNEPGVFTFFGLLD